MSYLNVSRFVEGVGGGESQESVRKSQLLGRMDSRSNLEPELSAHQTIALHRDEEAKILILFTSDINNNKKSQEFFLVTFLLYIFTNEQYTKTTGPFINNDLKKQNKTKNTTMCKPQSCNLRVRLVLTRAHAHTVTHAHAHTLTHACACTYAPTHVRARAHTHTSYIEGRLTATGVLKHVRATSILISGVCPS